MADLPKPVVFNVASYIPAVVLDRLPKQVLDLNWSLHALNEAVEEGFWVAPDQFDPTKAELVEVETNPGLFPTKFVYRLKRVDQGPPPNDKKVEWRNEAHRKAVRLAKRADMVIAVVKDLAKGYVVKTCWANEVQDKHASLRTDRLVPPPVCVPA